MSKEKLNEEIDLLKKELMENGVDVSSTSPMTEEEKRILREIIRKGFKNEHSST